MFDPDGDQAAEAIRARFGIEKPDLIGFSYLGKLVILYATQYADHVNRIVQIGPVARKLGTKFPETLTAGDADKEPDPAQQKKLDDLYKTGFAKDHPKEFCEMEWKIEQQRKVGDPTNAARLASPTEMENAWPVLRWSPFLPLDALVCGLYTANGAFAQLASVVRTVHGRKDRHGSYGGGGEWDMLLPNARLIAGFGAAHMSWVEFPQNVFPSIDA